MLNFENNNPWSDNETRMLRYMLENDGMQFLRYFFKFREGTRLRINWHHYVVEYVLQACIDRKITRLIINIPPGYTKTEQAVISFISRGLALNPRSKYIHSSSSADLAHDNSLKIKDSVKSPQYQVLWPMKPRMDQKGKKKWFTEHGGGMLASAAEGQIIGFRAGRMDDCFTGALINDDPLKSTNAFSAPKRKKVNDTFTGGLRSRLAIETVPIINIMQRLHDDDLTGFLLRGGSGDKWHHLCIPVFLDHYCLPDKYPEDFTHGKHIDIAKVLHAITTGEDYEF